MTSTVLRPGQALEYYKQVRSRLPDLSVVGIAGPGDPFANAEETMETLPLVHQEDPEVLLCVATNGLSIGPYLDDLAELEVSHVTITINAVDPLVGRKIYAGCATGRACFAAWRLPGCSWAASSRPFAASKSEASRSRSIRS